MDVEALRAIFRDHHVAVAYMFGSRAAGTSTDRSDHDMAVLFDGHPGLFEVGALQMALASQLGTAVDVVELDRATLELQAAVIQTGRLLHSTDEPRRVTFESTTRSRWFDFRPVVEHLTRAYLRRVATKGL